MFLEFGLRRPGAQIRLAAPTGIELRKITGPIMRTILTDCPLEMRPKWNGQDKVWTLHNESQIHIAGVNSGHEDDLRGTGADLAGVDEGGFVDRIDYLVRSVLMPQTLDRDGTMLISSTPPPSPAHDYVSLALECQKEGTYIERDIHSTDYTPAKIARYAKAAGGVGSTTWKREYLSQFVRDSVLAVIPEWDSDVYVREAEPDPRRVYWHQYETLDIGETQMDFQAVLFAFYDFANARLVVEDELIDSTMPRMSTKGLGDSIKVREIELWAEEAEEPEPPSVYKRIADNNDPQLLVDLAANQGLPFYPTTKESLAAMVNKVRMWVKDGRIWVHPRCVNLRACLKLGTWKDIKHINREFIRSRELGHLDALAALIYLVRGVDEGTNPLPAGYGLDPSRQYIPPHLLKPPLTPTAKALQGAFGRRKVN